MSSLISLHSANLPFVQPFNERSHYIVVMVHMHSHSCYISSQWQKKCVTGLCTNLGVRQVHGLEVYGFSIMWKRSVWECGWLKVLGHLLELLIEQCHPGVWYWGWLAGSMGKIWPCQSLYLCFTMSRDRKWEPVQFQGVSHTLFFSRLCV